MTLLNPLFWVQAVALALGQIWANKIRSLLTALGIIVGVASVSAVIAALSGLKTRVLTEFESFGANRLLIFPDRPSGAPRNLYPWEEIRLKQEELLEIGENCPSIRTLTPITTLGASVQHGQTVLDGLSITGIWSAWHDAENRKVIAGRPFVPIDEANARQVCLINEEAATELRLPRDPVGEHLLIGGRRFLIVGVVETVQQQMFGMNTSSAEIFVPFSVAAAMQEPDFFFRIVAMVRSPDVAEEAKSEVRFVLRRMRGLRGADPDTFSVTAIDQFIEQFKALAAGITAVAGGIVGVSLLVGGIGIMNIMLVAVSERTREIGLRKAVGATPVAILAQFLLEAVTLCLLGGLIGLLFGQGLAFVISSIPNAGLEEAKIPGWAVAMSFGFSAAVGVLFGMFPAIKAARLDPIEALRHE